MIKFNRDGIKYKTEGFASLRNLTPLTTEAEVRWVKGGNFVTVSQDNGNASRISLKLDKQQLLLLGSLADKIGDDIEPGMGSLEKPE